MTSKLDIIIIGAGISGLSCAKELVSYTDDINLLILEASDRIGGRAKTVKADDGTTIELGAHYFHGTKNNPLYDFTVNSGILSHNADTDEPNMKKCFTKDLLSSFTDDELAKAIKLGESYLKKVLTDMYALSEVDINHYKTVGSFVFSRFEHILGQCSLDERIKSVVKSVFMTWINEEKISSGCTSIFDLDLKGFLTYEDLEGTPLFVVSDHCPNGYEDVINGLSKDIPSKCIHTDCEVVKIENILDMNCSKMKVTCHNGEVFKADSIVLTVSIGVLKEFLTTDVFQVDLTEDKISCIQKLQMGNTIKIYFKFKVPIEDDVDMLQFYPSPESLSFLDMDKEHRLFQIDRVGASDWWLFWLVCSEGFKMDYPGDFLNDTMSYFFKTYSDFHENMVDKDTIITSDWVTNPFYRGTYTYLKNCVTEKEIDDLSKPLCYGRGNLLFAGEGTCRRFYSTAHGAYISGIREAGRIKNIYGLN